MMTLTGSFLKTSLVLSKIGAIYEITINEVFEILHTSVNILIP